MSKNNKEQIAVLISGASGVIYGLRALEVLRDKFLVHLVISKGARLVVKEETDLSLESFLNHENIKLYKEDDFAAPISSGSFLTKLKGVVVIPCSMGTLGAIANGVSSNLIHRVCDVALKEKIKLVLVIREMPYNLIHIKNMETLTLAGAIIAPASPGFYHKPKTLDDVIDFVVGKALDLLNIEHNLFKRWKTD